MLPSKGQLSSRARAPCSPPAACLQVCPLGLELLQPGQLLHRFDVGIGHLHPGATQRCMFQAGCAPCGRCPGPRAATSRAGAGARLQTQAGNTPGHAAPEARPQHVTTACAVKCQDGS